MQVGAGHSAGLRWHKIDTAFENRIQTNAMINFEFELRQFLEDAREIILEFISGDNKNVSTKNYKVFNPIYKNSTRRAHLSITQGISRPR